MKKIIVFGLIVVLMGIGAWYLVMRENSEPRYKTSKVHRADVESMVTATGNVNAVTTVLVGTQVSGTIRELYVDYNSQVKEGQPLAQIDHALFQAQVEQARSNLLNAEANYKKNKASLADAQLTFERNKLLMEKDFIARSDLDTSKTNVQTAEAQVEAARASVLQNRAALDQAQTNLRYTRIISPVKGTVISRNVDVGQTVAASFQTPTLFTIAEDLTKMQIDTSVDEADIGNVKVNQEVRFTVDAYPDTGFSGRVSEIRNAAVVVQNVVTYNVVVQVSNPELKLRPGMTANVSIIISRKTGVLAVPNGALRFRPQNQGEETGNMQGGKPEQGKRGPAVWILEENKPKRVDVSVGISDGSVTEIVSGPLKEGQDIIVSELGQENKQTEMRPRFFH